MIFRRHGSENKFRKTDDVKKILESNRIGKFAKEFYDKDHGTNISESIIWALEARSSPKIPTRKRLRQYMRGLSQREQKNESNVLLNHLEGYRNLENHVSDKMGRLETHSINPYLKKTRNEIMNLETGPDFQRGKTDNGLLRRTRNPRKTRKINLINVSKALDALNQILI